MSGSKKYKSLSICEKKKLISALECGDKKSDVARQFGIPFSILATILKKKDLILASSANGAEAKIYP